MFARARSQAPTLKAKLKVLDTVHRGSPPTNENTLVPARGEPVETRTGLIHYSSFDKLRSSGTTPSSSSATPTPGSQAPDCGAIMRGGQLRSVRYGEGHWHERSGSLRKCPRCGHKGVYPELHASSTKGRYFMNVTLLDPATPRFGPYPVQAVIAASEE